MQGGDDLEDDFVPDDTVALSGDEGFGTATHLEGEEDIFLDAGDDEGQGGDEDEAEDVLTSPVTSGDPELVSKKRKRREKEKERKAKVRPSQPFTSMPIPIFASRNENWQKLLRLWRGQ
jgi:protein CMS1